jgi:hypothetical protein
MTFYAVKDLDITGFEPRTFLKFLMVLYVMVLTILGDNLIGVKHTYGI